MLKKSLRNKVFLFLFSIISPIVGYCGNTTELYSESITNATEVAVIFDNFRRLDAGKLDLKPGDIIPKRDSTYFLGESGTEFAGIFVDSVTASYIAVTQTAAADAVKVLDSGTTTFYIYDGGIIDMAAQSSVRAFRSANITNGVGTSATKVSLSSETYDTQGEFDSTTNFRFTATKAGKYSVDGCVASTGLGASNLRLTVFLYKNGVEHSQHIEWSTGTGDMSSCVSDKMELAAADYVELYCSTSAAASKDVAGGSSKTFLAVQKDQ